MATPTKEQLAAKLRALNVTPPEGASSRELQDLLKKVKSLPERLEPAPALPAESQPPAGTSSAAPPLTPPRPLASPPTATIPPQNSGNLMTVTTKVSTASAPVAAPTTFVPQGRIPAVSAPAPLSDHEQRPWDPLAGY